MNVNVIPKPRTEVKRCTVDGGHGDTDGAEERREVLCGGHGVAQRHTHIHGADEDVSAEERDRARWWRVVSHIALGQQVEDIQEAQQLGQEYAINLYTDAATHADMTMLRVRGRREDTAACGYLSELACMPFFRTLILLREWPPKQYTATNSVNSTAYLDFEGKQLCTKVLDAVCGAVADIAQLLHKREFEDRGDGLGAFVAGLQHGCAVRVRKGVSMETPGNQRDANKAQVKL